MKRVVRSRLLHYLVLGALLVAARNELSGAWIQPNRNASPEIVVSAQERAQIRRRLGIPDGALPAISDRERALVEEVIDDEVLYRAALEIGLDQGNAVVRERVVQDMRVLSGSDATSDDEALREGLRLGLDRSDMVVRRHLAATMRLLAAAPARMDAAGEGDLREVLAREAHAFRVPAATTLQHVFFSNRRGRADAEERSRRTLAELNGSADSEARGGDAFALGPVLRERTDADLDSIFGPGFAVALAAAPERTWIGPMESRYGLHLVRVESRREARVPPLDAVRRGVIERFRSERARRQLGQWLARERARYTIRIEDPADSEPLLEQASLSVELLQLPRPAAVVGD